MVLIVKLNGKYLKEVDGFQALEWTCDVKKALQFNEHGAPYAYQIADTYGACVVRFGPDTDAMCD